MSGPRSEIHIPAAPGEVIDKISILEIKLARVAEAAKRRNVERELAHLIEARDAQLPVSPALDRLAAELKFVNERLWEVEDALRDCERRGEFGATFVELARSVYRTNDRRAALKRRINELLGSTIVEEKLYAAY